MERLPRQGIDGKMAKARSPVLLRTGNMPVLCFERVTAYPVFSCVANRKWELEA